MFSKKFGKITANTTATWVAPSAINCSLPTSWMNLGARQFVIIKVVMNNSNSEYVVWESLNFLVYPPPVITQVRPNTGLLSGNTKVVIHGTGLDQTMGGVYAKFGSVAVKCI
jgi:hypothetical protein